MKAKSEVFHHFKKLKNFVKKEIGQHIKCLQDQMVEESTFLMSLAGSWITKASSENTHAGT